MFLLKIVIALSSSDDNKMQSIDSIKTYTYQMNKNLVHEKEEIKSDITIKQYKNV